MTDNTKRKSTKRRTMIYNTLHKNNLKIEQH